jgi:two-component system CheB/CheR fusion protein
MATVQEQSSAEYDRMPLSPSTPGLPTTCCRPADAGRVAQIRAAFRALESPRSPEPTLSRRPDRCWHCCGRAPFDFRAYRKRMLLRRVLRRMGLNHRTGSPIIWRCCATAGRAQPAKKDLLISVTSFATPKCSRSGDPGAAGSDRGRVIRTRYGVWVPGCATGRSLFDRHALIERIAAAGKSCPIQIFATDVDEGALEVARRGIYPEALVADLPRQQLERFFTRSDPHHWQVSKQLRETVLFAPQNILADAPFSKLELVSCRNLLIYLEPEVQQKLLQLFHFALNEGGYLILGPSESIGQHTELYRPVSKKWRIFHRMSTVHPAHAGFQVQAGKRMSALHPAPSPVSAQHKNLSELTRKILLEEYAPAAVVINRRYEVLHYSGPTHLYLQQPGGPPSQDLLTLALAALRPRIRAAAIKAINEEARVDIGGIRIKRAGHACPGAPFDSAAAGQADRGTAVAGHFPGRAGDGPGSRRKRRTGQNRRTAGAPAGVRAEDLA